MWNGILLFLIVCVVVYVLCKITDSTHNKSNKIKFYYNYLMFFLLSGLGSTIVLPICFVRPMNVLNGKIGAQIIKFMTDVLIKDLKWELRNSEVLAEERGAVIVSNHQSAFDVLGMFFSWGTVHKMAAIAKKELFYLWPFGLSAYLSGVVFINRNKSADSYKQLEEISKIINKNKTKVWIFPEGTRNKNGSKLLPFKKGGFHIAVATQVPIIPVVFSPYYFIDAKNHIFNKGKIIIKCLKPIPTEGLTMADVPELASRVQQIMIDAYIELSKDVLNTLPADYFHMIE